MSTPRITIRMNAGEDTVTVADKGRSTAFDRSVMTRPERNKLARLIGDALEMSK
jgi:hypothetical protein